MPAATLSSSDDSDVSEVATLTNGVKHLSTNGVAKKDESKESDTEQCEAGMKNGSKQLYSGKEDKKGRFQWQDKVPEDIGNPAENNETAKWALLVRNVKVYNDPQRVLAIHSIVVQSPLLKKMLTSVLKDYPGVTVGLNRLEFSGKFEPLIHRWTELQEAIGKLGNESEDNRTIKAHALLHTTWSLRRANGALNCSSPVCVKRESRDKGSGAVKNI